MTVQANIKALQLKLQALSLHSDKSVQLLAVSKGQSASDIKLAFDSGICDFGESYWQEAQAKIVKLSHLPVHWHFIGSLQSNKCKMIANAFEWVHSVSREKTAMMLDKYRDPKLGRLNICIEVNIDNEPQKSGVIPSALDLLITKINVLPNLALRGLMSIPKASATDDEKLSGYQQVASLLQTLNTRYRLKMDTLSMGMSNDYPLAISAGSTIVRIGREIFGARQT